MMSYEACLPQEMYGCQGNHCSRIQITPVLTNTTVEQTENVRVLMLYGLLL